MKTLHIGETNAVILSEVPSGRRRDGTQSKNPAGPACERARDSSTSLRSAQNDGVFSN